MKKTDRKGKTKEAPTGVQLTAPLADFVREELRTFVIAQGMVALAAMLEQDRTKLCGAGSSPKSRQRSKSGCRNRTP